MLCHNRKRIKCKIMISPADTCALIGHSWTFKEERKVCLRCGLVVAAGLNSPLLNPLTEETAADLQIDLYLIRKQEKELLKQINSCFNKPDNE